GGAARPGAGQHPPMGPDAEEGRLPRAVVHRARGRKPGAARRRHRPRHPLPARVSGRELMTWPRAASWCAFAGLTGWQLAATEPLPMNEFKKIKMTFALALLGTLFALHPIVDKYPAAGFNYRGQELKVSYAYALAAGLLALAVYCYAVAFVSEHSSAWMEKVGNSVYALALMTVPLYGGLYLAQRLADELHWPHLELVAPVAVVVLGLGLAWWLRKRLGDQDRTARAQQLAEQELVALDRARGLFDSEHYDLSVIEAWKAIEARRRRVLLARKITTRLDNAQAMIDAAVKAGVVRGDAVDHLQQLRKQWNIAVSVEPITREAAESALNAARHILSTI